MNEKETILEKLNKVITFAGTVILMNLLFLVCCLPIVTIGQAWCALLTGVRYKIRKDSWFEGFKKGFKTRFWRGLIAWCVMLIPNIYFVLELHHGWAQVFVENNSGNAVQLISACVMLAMTTMATAGLLMLNVYIPTKVSIWITNATAMVFKAPLMLLIFAGLMWLPVLLGVLRFDWLLLTLMIFLVAYFPLAGLVSTLALKSTLMDYLIDARAEGTLLAEEGKFAQDEPYKGD